MNHLAHSTKDINEFAMLALARRYTYFVFFTLSAVVNEKQSKTIRKVLPVDLVLLGKLKAQKIVKKLQNYLVYKRYQNKHYRSIF